MNVPVPTHDIGVETKRTLERIILVRVRVIVIHAEANLARLMMGTARNAGLLDGRYIFLGTSVWTYAALFFSCFAVFCALLFAPLTSVVCVGAAQVWYRHRSRYVQL